LKRKETGLRIARESGDSAMAEVFSKNIDAHKANMNKFFGEYSNALHELSKYRGSTVRRIFTESVEKKDPGSIEVNRSTETERARLQQLVRENYEQLSNTGSGPAQETMLQKCPG
jgi:hypothetical protein